MANRNFGIIIGGIFLFCSILSFFLTVDYEIDMVTMQVNLKCNFIMLIISLVFFVFFLMYAFLLSTTSNRDWNVLSLEEYKATKYGPFKDRF